MKKRHVKKSLLLASIFSYMLHRPARLLELIKAENKRFADSIRRNS